MQPTSSSSSPLTRGVDLSLVMERAESGMMRDLLPLPERALELIGQLCEDITQLLSIFHEIYLWIEQAEAAALAGSMGGALEEQPLGADQLVTDLHLAGLGFFDRIQTLRSVIPLEAEGRPSPSLPLKSYLSLLSLFAQINGALPYLFKDQAVITTFLRPVSRGLWVLHNMLDPLSDYLEEPKGLAEEQLGILESAMQDCLGAVDTFFRVSEANKASAESVPLVFILDGAERLTLAANLMRSMVGRHLRSRWCEEEVIGERNGAKWWSQLWFAISVALQLGATATTLAALTFNREEQDALQRIAIARASVGVLGLFTRWRQGHHAGLHRRLQGYHDSLVEGRRKLQAQAKLLVELFATVDCARQEERSKRRTLRSSTNREFTLVQVRALHESPQHISPVPTFVRNMAESICQRTPATGEREARSSFSPPSRMGLAMGLASVQHSSQAEEAYALQQDQTLHSEDLKKVGELLSKQVITLGASLESLTQSSNALTYVTEPVEAGVFAGASAEGRTERILQGSGRLGGVAAASWLQIRTVGTHIASLQSTLDHSVKVLSTAADRASHRHLGNTRTWRNLFDMVGKAASATGVAASVVEAIFSLPADLSTNLLHALAGVDLANTAVAGIREHLHRRLLKLDEREAVLRQHQSDAIALLRVAKHALSASRSLAIAMDKISLSLSQAGSSTLPRSDLHEALLSVNALRPQIFRYPNALRSRRGGLTPEALSYQVGQYVQTLMELYDQRSRLTSSQDLSAHSMARTSPTVWALQVAEDLEPLRRTWTNIPRSSSACSAEDGVLELNDVGLVVEERACVRRSVERSPSRSSPARRVRVELPASSLEHATSSSNTMTASKESTLSSVCDPEELRERKERWLHSFWSQALLLRLFEVRRALIESVCRLRAPLPSRPSLRLLAEQAAGWGDLQEVPQGVLCMDLSSMDSTRARILSCWDELPGQSDTSEGVFDRAIKYAERRRSEQSAEMQVVMEEQILQPLEERFRALGLGERGRVAAEFMGETIRRAASVGRQLSSLEPLLSQTTHLTSSQEAALEMALQYVHSVHAEGDKVGQQYNSPELLHLAQYLYARSLRFKTLCNVQEMLESTGLSSWDAWCAVQLLLLDFVPLGESVRLWGPWEHLAHAVMTHREGVVTTGLGTLLGLSSDHCSVDVGVAELERRLRVSPRQYHAVRARVAQACGCSGVTMRDMEDRQLLDTFVRAERGVDLRIPAKQWSMVCAALQMPFDEQPTISSRILRDYAAQSGLHLINFSPELLDLSHPLVLRACFLIDDRLEIASSPEKRDVIAQRIEMWRAYVEEANLRTQSSSEDSLAPQTDTSPEPSDSSPEGSPPRTGSQKGLPRTESGSDELQQSPE